MQPKMVSRGVADGQIEVLEWGVSDGQPLNGLLTPSTPAVPNCCCSKGPVSYWSNLPFLIFNIRALWCSGLSSRVLEC